MTFYGPELVVVGKWAGLCSSVVWHTQPGSLYSILFSAQTWCTTFSHWWFSGTYFVQVQGATNTKMISRWATSSWSYTQILVTDKHKPGFRIYPGFLRENHCDVSCLSWACGCNTFENIITCICWSPNANAEMTDPDFAGSKMVRGTETVKASNASVCLV